MRITYGDGLWMPPAVAKATSDFENDNDHVAEFIKACVDFGEGCSVRLADVNKAYQQHRGKGPDALKSRALYSRIIDYCRANGYPVTKDPGTSTACSWPLRYRQGSRYGWLEMEMCKTCSSTVRTVAIGKFYGLYVLKEELYRGTANCRTAANGPSLAAG